MCTKECVFSFFLSLVVKKKGKTKGDGERSDNGAKVGSHDGVTKERKRERERSLRGGMSDYVCVNVVVGFEGVGIKRAR